MRRRLLAIALPLAAVSAALRLLLPVPPEPVKLPDAELRWEACDLSVPWWRPVFCGTLERRVDGMRFTLPVRYLPAMPWRRDHAPVLYLAGGPGGETGLDPETLPLWLDWRDEVGWSGDLVLFDQRGTGLARPRLDCPEVRRARRELVDSALPREIRHRRVSAAQRACLRRLEAAGHDLRRYHTPANAEDALALVRALGLRRWRLYGVSYGTRIGLEILRRDPPGLEAAVLDSVYPPQVQAEAADPWLLARAVELALGVCERIGCDTAPERMRRLYAHALARLREAPARLRLRDPERPAALWMRLEAEDLPWLLFDAQYQWYHLERLPALLAELADGRPGPATRLLAQESLDARLGGGVSEAVANAVDCTDNGALSETRYRRALARHPAVVEVLRSAWRHGPCRFWPRGPVGDSFRRPVRSRLPVLLLAGEFDPVTPPEWAELAARTLPRSSLFVLPGIGHGVLDSDLCAVDLVRAFWERPAAPRPPACVEP